MNLMMRQRTTVVNSAVGLMLAGVAITGCSSTSTVPKANVESVMLTQMNGALEEAGLMVSAVTCPGDIEKKVGATINCEVSLSGADGTRTGVLLVTVISVDDGGAQLEGEITG